MVDFLQPEPRHLFADFMDNLIQLIQPNSLWALVPLCSIVYLARQLWPSRKGAKTTPLAGPPNTSWLLGVARRMVDDAAMVEAWVEEYGPVFCVPAALGSSTVVLTDPAAVAHFYAADSWTYAHPQIVKSSIEELVRPRVRRSVASARSFTRWCSSGAGCCGQNASPIRGVSRRRNL